MTPAAVTKELTGMVIESLSSQPNTVENKKQLRTLLARLRQRHPGIFSEALSDVVNERGEDGRTEIDQLILSLSVVSPVTTNEVSAYATLARQAWISYHQSGRAAESRTS